MTAKQTYKIWFAEETEEECSEIGGWDTEDAAERFAQRYVNDNPADSSEFDLKVRQPDGKVLTVGVSVDYEPTVYTYIKSE
jgi:hypothetical protein